MVDRVGREDHYLTLQHWADVHGFVPPSRWLAAMEPRGRNRDSDRKRVYVWEHEFAAGRWLLADSGHQGGSLAQWRRWIAAAGAEFLSTFWEREAIEEWGGLVPAPRVVGRAPARSRYEGKFSVRRWRIALTAWDASDKTVLHEAAHALTPHHGHDAEFQRVASRLYERYLDTARRTIGEPHGRGEIGDDRGGYPATVSRARSETWA